MGQENSVNHQNTHRIYLIDDEPSARTILRLLLEHEGYQCLEAEGALSALAFLQKGKTVDLIITDNQMPCMTGLEFLKRLPESLPYSPPPVIMYTGQLTTHVQSQAFEQGAYAVLSKPYTFSEIIHTVHKVLSPQSPHT